MPRHEITWERLARLGLSAEQWIETHAERLQVPAAQPITVYRSPTTLYYWWSTPPEGRDGATA